MRLCTLFPHVRRAGQPPGDCIAERHLAGVRLAEKRRQDVPAEKLYAYYICWPYLPCIIYSRSVLVFRSEFKGDWATTQSG